MTAPMLLALLLLSCCPAPLAQQASAFRAEVVGVGDAPGAEPVLYVRLLQGASRGAPLTEVAVADAQLWDSSGAPLALSALQAGGAQVYLTGTLRADRLWAREVRVVAENGLTPP